MRRTTAFGMTLAFGVGQAAAACTEPVCLVDPDSLSFTEIITFDDLAAHGGPGRYVDGTLPLPGAAFGEHFAGQSVASDGAHDQVEGSALAPLRLRAGPNGQNFSIVRFSGQTVINGYGASGFPRRDAQGEGAIAVLFDDDQSAFAFDLRGGEEGAAAVTVFRRDGTALGTVPIAPTGEFAVGFLRREGQADIAGFVFTNKDPQGLAMDTLRFGKPPDLS